MHLAIDIGNTQTLLGVAEAQGPWFAQWRLRTDRRRTADEHRLALAALFAEAGLEPRSVLRVTFSCVVPELTPVISAVAVRLFGQRPLALGPGTKTGLAVRYRPPEALGTDRVATAVAARALYGSPVVVVDFGTATAFSVVDAAGDFVGGALAPGVGISASGLAAAGARLRRIDLTSSIDVPLIGRTTEQSMRAGVLYGYAGLVDGMLARFDQELEARPPVVATGGWAALVAPLVQRIDHAEPLLILEGLRLIGMLNPADE